MPRARQRAPGASVDSASPARSRRRRWGTAPRCVRTALVAYQRRRRCAAAAPRHIAADWSRLLPRAIARSRVRQQGRGSCAMRIARLPEGRSDLPRDGASRPKREWPHAMIGCGIETEADRRLNTIAASRRSRRNASHAGVAKRTKASSTIGGSRHRRVRAAADRPSKTALHAETENGSEQGRTRQFRGGIAGRMPPPAGARRKRKAQSGRNFEPTGRHRRAQLSASNSRLGSWPRRARTCCCPAR